MRGGSKISTDAAAFRFAPENHFDPVYFGSVFLRSAPLEVDLGCGDGSYVAALAARHPQSNFVAIERLAGRVRSACNRLARLNLTNVRILQIDSSHAVQHLLMPASVARFHLLFPDPWPKRRHHRRRVVDDRFLGAIATALLPGGTIRIVTDDVNYFSAIVDTARHTDRLSRIIEPDGEQLPASTFEQRFRDRGLGIYRLVLRKTCDMR